MIPSVWGGGRCEGGSVILLLREKRILFHLHNITLNINTEMISQLVFVTLHIHINFLNVFLMFVKEKKQWNLYSINRLLKNFSNRISKHFLSLLLVSYIILTLQAEFTSMTLVTFAVKFQTG